MMGLFGSSFDDPKTQGMLQLAAGLMSAPRFGHGLSQGLMAYGDTMARAKQQQAQEQMQKLQMQQMQMQMEQQRQAQEQQQRDRSILQQQYSPMAGPTQDQAPLMPRFDPRHLLGKGGSPDAIMQAMQLEQAMNPARKPIVSKPGDIARDETGNVLWQNPAEEKQPEQSALAKLMAERDKFPLGHPARAVYDQAIKKTATHQPPASVTVPINLGQKGFDNTLKLRGDFRSEPVYKAYQEVQSAHAQIKQSIAANSAIGDTAAATKIMKILDPTSVVRESELGMALAATGLLDKVMNYADLIIKGQRLNPQQRKDFAALADALYGESVKAYNAKRGEYQGIAERNQLSTDDVLGPAPTTPQPPAAPPKVLRFDAQGNPIKD
jgi:hypothetical protein